MADSSYFRDRAEQALRRARDSSDQMVAERLIERAAESLGRADAIELVNNLKEIAAALAAGDRCLPGTASGEVSQPLPGVASIQPVSGQRNHRVANCHAQVADRISRNKRVVDRWEEALAERDWRGAATGRTVLQKGPVNEKASPGSTLEAPLRNH